MVTRVYHSLLDNLELLIGKRDKSAPPRRLIKQTGIGLDLVAEESIQHLLELAELKPDASVLEVGCGCGCSARLLTRRLADRGGYWGFDVDAESIAWCQKHLEANRPNFHFQLADVYDELFRPKGRFKPAVYRFPYLDDYFDLVLIAAAFTRMAEAEMQNYLSQVRRVLKPGGRCAINFFLINEESKRLISEGLGTVNVSCANRDYQLSQRNHCAAPVSYEERFIRECWAKQGLNVLEPIHYGNWCGRSGAFHCPDILVATKLAVIRPVTDEVTAF